MTQNATTAAVADAAIAAAAAIVAAAGRPLCSTLTSQSAYDDFILCGSGWEESSSGRSEIAQFQSVSIPMLSARACATAAKQVGSASDVDLTTCWAFKV